MITESLQHIDETIDERMNLIRQGHEELFGQNNEITIAYAPGRAEILGNHTDYNEGYTLSANVSSNVLIAASERSDTTVRIQSQNMPGPVVEFDASSGDSLWQQKSEAHTPDAWSNYVKGVFWTFTRAGHSLTGFDAVIESTVPTGGGLSSSAALETVVARLLCQFNDLPVPSIEQVSLCKQAENEYVGAPCGFLDQATVGLADDWLLMSYRPQDGQPFTYDSVEVDLARTQKLLVVGYDPDSKHSLVDGKYALRQQACFGSLPVLSQLVERNVPALRDITSEQLEACRKELVAHLGQQAVNFVTHVVYENERVMQAAEALRAGNISRFGELMTASGDSAINLYELAEDAPELRFIYETLAAEPAAYGALGIRNMGGGFNATTLALIEADRLTEYEELLSRRYREEFGRDYQFLSFVPAPAACILES